ncbi:MAG: SMP-30/gluconolactonase/LRE family protein [Proteobacteria bacterium]|nr:SMP-30/gluconolactonase/LRE family protein [Pseudomonadota bacterium]
MKKITRMLAIAVLAVTAYLCLWPVPIEPVSWQAPAAPGYSGPHAPNNRLADIQLIALNGETGPEHVAPGPDGKLYAAMASGNIVRMNPGGTAQEIFVNTGGRVLGFDFDADGNLIAADAMKGLLSIGPDRAVRVLIDTVNGDPVRYANAVVVAANGKIYFTDASTRFAPKDWDGTFAASILDIMEQSSTGRVLEYDPTQKTARIIAQGLSFANGIALSQDEQTLFVNETGRYRVWKIAVSANNLDVSQGSSMQAAVLLDNLPGYPDNLMRGLDGKIWLGFAKPRNPVIDAMSGKPFLRQVTLRLPPALWPVPKAYGHVIAFSEDGKVLDDLQDPSGAYPETTAVTETRDRLYIQSLHAKGLGWLARTE